MANSYYNKGLNKFLTADIDLLNDTISALLIDTDLYIANFASDEFLSVIPAQAIVASVTLTGKSCVDGVFDANDTTFTAVSGAACEAVVLVKSTGATATSALICFIDEIEGLPVTPNGGDLTIRWSASTEKIFTL